MPEARPPPVGSLAIVLHSHMPYVEGFGTYPFGEEWLFDAVCRSYLPVLEVGERLTVTVTPVLADQLEAPGVAERLTAFVERYRLGAAEADRADMGREFDAACAGAADRYRAALDHLARLGGDLTDAFREARARGVELIPSAASHAVLPLVATLAGRRLQVDTGVRAHRRRFGPSAGFWLPECAYEPGLERLLAEREVRYFCVDQSAHEAPLRALQPVATGAGPVAFTIDWEAVEWLWSLDGYPADPAHADLYRGSARGTRVWSVGGGPYDPAVGAARAREQAAEFVDAVAARLDAYRAERGRPGLVVFALDTELLGHWWWEGPVWLAEVLRRARGSRVELLTLSEAFERHPAERRGLRRASWGEGKDLGTWDSPEVADLTWAARRLELRLIRALGTRLDRHSAERAARELLALQASDWAFLDRRRQAGDYPFQRATAHAEAMLRAIHSGRGRPPDPAMRNLAPDLSLAPLLEPETLIQS
jgi:1,4-alpha-glucan branching enzyme